jgi:hypothetical protein
MGFVAYLRGFVPWIVAGVVSGVLLLLQDLRRGVDLDALILEGDGGVPQAERGCPERTEITGLPI